MSSALYVVLVALAKTYGPKMTWEKSKSIVVVTRYVLIWVSSHLPPPWPFWSLDKVDPFFESWLELFKSSKSQSDLVYEIRSTRKMMSSLWVRWGANWGGEKFQLIVRHSHRERSLECVRSRNCWGKIFFLFWYGGGGFKERYLSIRKEV